MDLNEQYYKKVISAIGWALLILWGLMQGFGVGITLLPVLLAALPISPVLSEVVYQLLHAAGYLLTFMLPVLFLRLILKKKGCMPHPIAFEARISPMLPCMAFASLAICFSAAQINAYMVEIFNYSEFTAEVLMGQNEKSEAYAIVLNFIVLSIVPGFCEELLFRGAILGNLMPFGRIPAILISSFFFAVMHQNAGQLFYTFAAGIVLGLIYERTGSIWNCTVIHILNNFVSVLQEAVYGSSADETVITAILLCIECVVYLLGSISAVILVLRYFRNRTPLEDGVFGRDLPASDSYAAYPLHSGRAARLLCTPTVIVFLALCCVQVLLLILMSLLGGFL
ncbi:MAG: CPBP family intramembrane metalloprotease [Ruminococcaceae bacterium]|nr:CPBP family intramembrane metalloprotease [Oscillospiraceae bacterium]